MQYLIGADIGTTNIKVIALAADGRLLAAAQRPTHTLVPFPGAAEQNPLAILRQTVHAIREVREVCKRYGKPAGLTFSGAMHSLLALDGQGNPLTHAWLWSDLRASQFAAALRHSDPGMELYRRTGTPIHPMSPLCKLLWMRKHQPQVFAGAHTFLGIKDFLLFKLLSRRICDASLASASGLLNTISGQWDELALKTAGITAGQLPEVVDPMASFDGQLASGLLAGVSEDIPVIPGASDGALANIGSGAIGSDTLAITIGTSAALRLTQESPSVDEFGRTFCYRVDNRRFIAGGASNNGSNVLDWLRRQVLHTRMPASRLLEQAGMAPPGAAGILCLPYLHGERAPLWNAQATGAFYGLTAGHGRTHLLRAAVEGVVFNLMTIAQALPAADIVQSIVFSGGASQSRLWQQVLADVFQKPVSVQQADRVVDASARGAIILARKALRLAPMPAPENTIKVLPQLQNIEIYKDALARFTQLCGRKMI